MRDKLWERKFINDTVAETFDKVQIAWEKQDVSIASHLLTGSLCRQMSIELTQMKHDGLVNIIPHYRITDIEIV